MVFGTRSLKYWVLGPSGHCILATDRQRKLAVGAVFVYAARARVLATSSCPFAPIRVEQSPQYTERLSGPVVSKVRLRRSEPTLPSKGPQLYVRAMCIKGDKGGSWFGNPTSTVGAAEAAVLENFASRWRLLVRPVWQTYPSTMWQLHGMVSL